MSVALYTQMLDMHPPSLQGFAFKSNIIAPQTCHLVACAVQCKEQSSLIGFGKQNSETADSFCLLQCQTILVSCSQSLRL